MAIVDVDGSSGLTTRVSCLDKYWINQVVVYNNKS